MPFRLSLTGKSVGWMGLLVGYEVGENVGGVGVGMAVGLDD